MRNETTTKTASQEITCPRCSGEGKLYDFNHIEKGVCFLCHGKKSVSAKSLLQKEGIELKLFRAFHPDTRTWRIAASLLHNQKTRTECLQHFTLNHVFSEYERELCQKTLERVLESGLGIEHMNASPCWT